MTGGRRGARIGLLREAGGFRLLFFATLASSIGTWLAFVALVIDVFDRTANASWVSALLVAEFLPSVAVGFLAGRLLDRVSRRWILVLADVVRAGVFFVLPFTTTALRSSCSRSWPASRRAFSDLRSSRGCRISSRMEDLPQANGLLQTADNFTWAIGALTAARSWPRRGRTSPTS